MRAPPVAVAVYWISTWIHVSAGAVPAPGRDLACCRSRCTDRRRRCAGRRRRRGPTCGPSSSSREPERPSGSRSRRRGGPRSSSSCRHTSTGTTSRRPGTAAAPFDISRPKVPVCAAPGMTVADPLPSRPSQPISEPLSKPSEKTDVVYEPGGPVAKAPGANASASTSGSASTRRSRRSRRIRSGPAVIVRGRARRVSPARAADSGGAPMSKRIDGFRSWDKDFSRFVPRLLAEWAEKRRLCSPFQARFTGAPALAIRRIPRPKRRTAPPAAIFGGLDLRRVLEIASRNCESALYRTSHGRSIHA